MKNVVFWDIKHQFVPHRRQITSRLQSPAGSFYIRFDFFTAMTIKMPSSEMLRRVALLRTDVSEERIAFIIRMTRIGELGITLAVTSNRRTLRRNTSISCYPDDGGAMLLQNVCCFKGHKV
jgi:hypothetical protein